MAGHSKWANIKRRKESQDSKRGKVWTKLIKEITIAARMGGGLPEGNPRLRDAIASSKGSNMPKDNIERAIKRGTGELEGVNYEEISYEGYGPGGVAVLIEVTTDNKNRTVSEIRQLFAKAGGNLGESGCVAWMFNKKGLIEIEGSSTNEEELFELATEAGAEDVQEQEGGFSVYTELKQLGVVRESLEKTHLKIIDSAITAIPQSTVTLTGDGAQKMLTLMDALEDHDDIQRVFSNFDISEEELNHFVG